MVVGELTKTAEGGLVIPIKADTSNATVGFTTVSKKIKETGTAAQQVGKEGEKGMSKMEKGLKRVAESSYQFAGQVMEGMTVMQAVKEGTSGLLESMLTSIGATLQQAFQNLVSSLGALGDQIQKSLGQAWENIKSGAAAAWNGITGGVQTAADTVEKAADSAKKGLENAWNSGVEATKKAGEAIKEGASNIGTNLSNTLGQAGQTIHKGFEDVASKATAFGGSLVTTVSTTAGDIIEKVKGGDWNGAASVVGRGVTDVKDTISSGLSTAVKKASDWTQDFGSTIKGGIDWLGAGAENAWKMGYGFADKIKGGLEDVVKNGWDFASDFANALCNIDWGRIGNDIMNGLGNLGSSIQQGASNLVSCIAGALGF